MSQQVINTGAYFRDATGDPLQTAFTKVNGNFLELWALAGLSGLPQIVNNGKPSNLNGGANDGTGDQLSKAFDKCNANFGVLFAATGNPPLNIVSDPGMPIIISAGDPASFVKMNLNFTYLYKVY